MKNILFCLLFVFSIVINSSAIANNAYQEAAEWQNRIGLKSPAEAKEVINYDIDTRDLQNLSDSDLSNRGGSQLQSTEAGEFLHNSQGKIVDANSEHQINSENPMLKNSLKIEENPMAEIGGSNPQITENIIETIETKSCIEGVEFDIDVGFELVFDCQDEQYYGPWREEQKWINIPGDDVFHGARHLGYKVHWKKKRNGWHIHNNSEEWRKYLSSYLKIPIDGELESIGPKIEFPFGARGILPTHPVYQDWIVVFNAYRFGYIHKKRDSLQRLKSRGEYWQVATPGTEQIIDSDQCYEVKRTCRKSGVKTFFGKYNISRPCWYEDVTYHCSSEPQNGCSYLQKQGCILQDSECLERSGSICLKYKRNYLCGGQKKELQYSLQDAPMQCMGGDCYRPVIEQNTDFANVAYLAAVNAAGKDCVKASGSICKNPITVFPGERGDCKKIITGCINCCSSMKGWGKGILSRCSGEEQGLAIKKDRGLCHNVGTYCSKRDPVFRKCLEKKTTHCCFNSKLARVFHQQGRGQLGIGWGSAENPNCAPLTLDQLTKIDFSKFDMEELFDVMLEQGKSNMKKSFPTLKPGQMPASQRDHYRTDKESREGGI
jgi:conjugal transfer mating pair stabilization protein TraN